MKFAKRLFSVIACMSLISPAAIAEKPQERLLSIGGDVTEIIYALGAEQQLIGRDSTSEIPEQAKKLPDVGYMRQLNTEGILALKPTRIIATQVAQPTVVLEQIKATGVQVDTVPFKYTEESVLEKIAMIGKLVGKEPEAKALAEQFSKEMQTIDRTPRDVKLLFILNRAGANQMVAGKHTVADSAIELLGAKNAMSNAARFVPISQEGVIAANPDVLIITKLGLESLGSLDKLWTLPGVAHTNAGKNKQVVVVEDVAFMTFGLGIAKELQKIRQAIDQVGK